MQRLIYHYDLFIQNVRLKKAVSKRIFFCLNATSGTLHGDRVKVKVKVKVPPLQATKALLTFQSLLVT